MTKAFVIILALSSKLPAQPIQKRTSTLIAKKGKLILAKDSTKILLENGSQQFQSKERKLSVLYFDEYLLDINQSDKSGILNRWKSPAERTLQELKNPDISSGDDQANLQAFKAEITIRYSMPLNILGFSILVLFVMLSFNFQRKENITRTLVVFTTIIFLQIVSIISSNLSIKFENMEFMNFFPFLFCLLSLIFFVDRSRKI